MTEVDLDVADSNAVSRSKVERQQLAEDGFALLPAVLTPAWTERIASRIPTWERLHGARRRQGITFAVSGVLSGDPELVDLLNASGVTSRVSDLVGQSVRPIDAFLFDKNPESNWKVPGHQDVMMPNAELPEPGPPSDVLIQGLVAARIHLDASCADNGPLAVVPGSHRRRLSDHELAALSLEQYRVCLATVGDVLVMRPLLVHRSAPSTTPRHRRVLHVVFLRRTDLSFSAATTRA